MKIKRIFQLNGNQIEELEGKTFSISEREWGLLNVYDVEKTWFDGFGGAITQSSAYNFSLLPEEEQNKVLELLVGKSGLRYKKFRLCIGSSDFATHSYCYVKDDDFDLSSFSIEEDKKEIIPFIKRLMDYASEDLSFFASSWSCPSFMKDNNDRLHGGHLKLEFYDLYAEYIVKFLLAYREEGIKISGITIQNEPKASQTWESCVFTAREEAMFGKVLKKHLLMHGLGEIKLYCWDHNKERLVDRACETFS
ncbi:MAG: glucosylceramidase, partial [Bacilli bacterium]|nr:glucosylceramidase [Bacilli bacterium]